MQRNRKWTYKNAVAVAKAERAVIRAAVGCINPQGHAYSIATEQIARTFFVDEPAFRRLEKAVANLKESRKHRPSSTTARPK